MKLLLIILLSITLFDSLLLVLIYSIIDSMKKNKKLSSKDTEELYNIKDMGEALRSFLGIIYVPAIILFFSQYKFPLWITIILFVAMSIAIVLVEIKICCCKKEIRKKESEK